MTRMKKIKQNIVHIGFISYKKDMTDNNKGKEHYSYVYFNNAKDSKHYEEKGFIGISKYYQDLQNVLNLNGILQEFMQKYRKPIFNNILSPEENISIKDRRKSIFKSNHTIGDFIKETLDYFNKRSDCFNMLKNDDFPLNEYKIHPDLLKQLPFIFEYGAILLFRPECEFVFREENVQDDNDNEQLIELLYKIESCSSIDDLEMLKKQYSISHLKDKLIEHLKNKSFQWNDIDMIKMDRINGCPMFVYNTKHRSLNLQINHKVSVNKIKEYITEKNISQPIEPLDNTDKFAINEEATFMVETKMKECCTYASLTDAVIEEFNNDPNARHNDDAIQKAFNRAIKRIYLLFKFRDEDQNIKFLNEFYKLYKN